MLSGSDISAVRASREAGHDTVIVGHGLDLNPRNPVKFTSDAAGLSDGYIGAGGTTRASLEAGIYVGLGAPTPLNQPAGGVVGLFTCNSTDVLAGGFPGQTVVSNDGGTDGYTSLGTLEQAAFGFVGTLVDTGNATAAMNTAQRVMDRRSNFVVTDPQAPSTVIGTNRGDTLHQRGPQ